MSSILAKSIQKEKLTESVAEFQKMERRSVRATLKMVSCLMAEAVLGVDTMLETLKMAAFTAKEHFASPMAKHMLVPGMKIRSMVLEN